MRQFRPGERSTLLTVAGIQLLARPRAWDENVARAEDWVRTAAATGAQVVLLPELFAIGSFYAEDLLDFVEGRTGRTSSWMVSVARAYRVLLAGTILERSRIAVFNSLILAEPSGQVVRYQKRNLGPLERPLIRPGRGPLVLKTSVGRIGCLICSDGSDARLCRSICRASVDLLLVPQAIGATVQLGYDVERMEENGTEPLWGPIVGEIGAPAVTAGLVGPFENPIPDRVGNYLRGGTYVIDGNGRALAHVAFPNEGVALATLPVRPSSADKTSPFSQAPSGPASADCGF
jgi:N-carbamoylputrescine amidase